MGKTEIYGLEYLEPYENTQFSIDIDERRFRTIESQTYVLYSIFGNGIIVDETSTSIPWEIQQSTIATTATPAVKITPGRGHIGFMAAYTTSSTDVELLLPPGASYPIKFYLYAIKTDTTPYAGEVNFVASTTTINDPYNYIGLGAVKLEVVDNGNISYTFYNDADNGRVEISLFATIGNVINKHKHIGGTYNPPPINLASHVQGKLSGDNIENLDLSTVTQGTLAPERLPQIDHNDLTRKGILTHPQIDTLLNTLMQGSTEGNLSDITTANMLQLALALKRSLSNNTDQNLINAILYVPGLNAASGFIDRYFAYYQQNNFNIQSPFVPQDIVLANFDTINHLISATTSASGTTSNSIAWYTYFDLSTIKSAEENNNGDINIDVSASGVTTAYMQLAKPIHYTGLASEDLSNWEWSYQVIGDDTLPAIVEGTPDIFEDQFNVHRYFYHKFVSSTTDEAARDITNTSKLQFFYKLPYISGAPTHPGDMYFYLIFNESYTNTTAVNLNAGTLNISQLVKFRSDTDALNTVLPVTININDFGSDMTAEQKANVTGIGICYKSDAVEPWDKNDVWFELLSPTIDLITDSRVQAIRQETSDTSSVYIWNDDLYESSETVRFRFNSGYANTLYSNVFATTTTETGITNIRIYTSVADTTTELLNSPMVEIGLNGEVRNPIVQNNRRYIDIIVKFSTNDPSKTPKLFNLTLIYSGPGASQPPKMWSIGKDWYAGTLSNLTVHNLPVLTDEKRPAKIYATSGYSVDTESPTSLSTNIYDAFNNITLGTGDRVLVSQSGTLSPHNGIFKVTSTDSTKAYLNRDDDANHASYFSDQFFLTINAGNSGYVGKTYNLKNTISVSGLDTDNIEFELYSNKNYLTISTDEINKIGQYTFIKNNNTYYSSNDETTPSDYIKADNLYLSPYQIFRKNQSPGFNEPRFMNTLPNGNVIIVDTGNDRIVELSPTNTLVKAIQGNIKLPKINRDFVVLQTIYNQTVGKMWIMFSQYVSASVDKNKMSITNGYITIPFTSTDTTTGGTINVTTLNSITSKSATLEITFPSTIQSLINSWVAQGESLQLNIDSTAVQCEGSDISDSEAESTNNTTVSTPTIPSYLTGPPAKFSYMGRTNYIGYSGLNTTGEMMGISGLSSTSTNDVDNGDFNNDGTITNSNTAVLMDANENTGRITLNIIVGDIIVDNIYYPLYIQNINDGWLVTCVGEHNVVFYTNTLTQSWNIPTSYIGFREGINASAWQMSNGLIVAATPSSVDATIENCNSEVLILNRTAGTTTNPTISIITRIPITRGDTIRAIPDKTEMSFWVAVDDRFGNGSNSRIMKVNYVGNTTWTWGEATDTKIYHPTDIKVLTNNTILVSE